MDRASEREIEFMREFIEQELGHIVVSRRDAAEWVFKRDGEAMLAVVMPRDSAFGDVIGMTNATATLEKYLGIQDGEGLRVWFFVIGPDGIPRYAELDHLIQQQAQYGFERLEGLDPSQQPRSPGPGLRAEPIETVGSHQLRNVLERKAVGKKGLWVAFCSCGWQTPPREYAHSRQGAMAGWRAHATGSIRAGE